MPSFTRVKMCYRKRDCQIGLLRSWHLCSCCFSKDGIVMWKGSIFLDSCMTWFAFCCFLHFQNTTTHFQKKGVLCKQILFLPPPKYKMHFHSKCPINLLLGNIYKLLWVKSKLLALFLYGWTPNVNREGWLSARFRYLDFRAKIVKKVTRVLQYYYP